MVLDKWCLKKINLLPMGVVANMALVIGSNMALCVLYGQAIALYSC